MGLIMVVLPTPELASRGVIPTPESALRGVIPTPELPGGGGLGGNTLP